MERFLSDIEQRAHDEKGFSTVGVALSLLITLALIFSAAQIYELESTSADIQEVADAAALAAENVVGEYCIVVTMCDAISLSLSLSSLCCLGLGVAAACTPVTASLSETLLETAQKLRQTQSAFTEKAQNALEEFKSILPLVAAAKASIVIEANSHERGSASYTGIVILVPWKTDPLKEHSRSRSDDAFQAVEDAREMIKELGSKAEKAAHDTNALKEEAYQHDSGSEDSYCMYERAKKLAGLSGTDNPYYASSETWGFDIALKRAQTYYHARSISESPENDSIPERVRSALRKHFYEYAAAEIQNGFVHQGEDSFDAYFPLMPKNTEEMKRTRLYTDIHYPISKSSDGKLTMHAFDGCPVYRSNEGAGYGSVLQASNDTTYAKCPQCEFDATSLGSVAAASSSIDNGFEYHYRKVAELASAYTEARRALDEGSLALKDKVDDIFGKVAQALEEAKGDRIQIDPPGKYGAIAFVATTNPGHANLITNLVNSDQTFRSRAALSGATLLDESTESGRTIMNNLLSGFVQEDVGGAIGGAQLVLDLWSGLLTGYGQGQVALSQKIRETIDAIPFASENGLGSWASEGFEQVIEELGIDPVDLSPQKAVLVNTVHIARADQSSFSADLEEVKISTLGRNSRGELFASILNQAEDAIANTIDDADFTIEIATIKIVQGSLEIPVTISLPQELKDSAKNVVHQAFSDLEDRIADFVYSRRWE